MATILTRRDALRLTAGGIVAMTVPGSSGAQVQRADVAAPKLPIESGASLRVLRPARFVEPDETIFRANTAKFQQTTGVETRVDFVGWEDIRQQTAVASNTGTGPDIVIGWADDPHVYVDKIIELSDVAEYLGKRYGGWTFLGEKYGKRDKTNNWIGIPFGGATGPIVYRRSAVKEAGFDKIPNDHAEYLKLCQALKKINKPAGFALGQRRRRRQRLRPLAGLVARRLPARRGRQGRDQQQGDGRGAHLSEGPLPDLHQRHAQLGRSQQQPRLCGGRLLADLERRLALFALKNDPAQRAIAEDTDHQALPFGIVGKAPQTALMLNAMLFRHSKYPNAAKSYIQFMMEAEQYDPWLTGCLGYWSHTLRAYAKSAVWDSDPKLEVYRNGTDHQFWSGYKGPITQASQTVAAEYVLVQMCASVASGDATPQEAAREAERRSRRYFRG